jgi:hypothetical protein
VCSVVFVVRMGGGNACFCVMYCNKQDARLCLCDTSRSDGRWWSDARRNATNLLPHDAFYFYSTTCTTATARVYDGGCIVLPL